MARVTGLEPATSGVTGRHSNRLSYTRACRSPGLVPCGVGRWIRGSPLGVKPAFDAIVETSKLFCREPFRHPSKVVISTGQDARTTAEPAACFLAGRRRRMLVKGLRSRCRPLKGPARAGD